jgi:Flp pilus assembly pilin Flp
MTSATEILKNPITIAVSIATAIGHMLGIGPITAVVSVLWANVSTLFTALSIAGLTLGPELAWIPEGPLTAAALIAGGAYVLKLLDRVFDQIQAKL